MENQDLTNDQQTSTTELLKKRTIPLELFPLVLSLILNEVCNIKSMMQIQAELSNDTPDEPLNIKQASKLLGLSVPTIYSKVSRREIPFFKPKGSKRLYFSKSELTDIIKSGRVKTTEEVYQDAEIIIKKSTSKHGK